MLLKFPFALASLLLSASAWAQSGFPIERQEALKSGCKRIETQQGATTNANGKVRATHVTYCEGNNGDNYVWFLLSAMHNDKFVGRNRSPWVEVRLFDRNNGTIFHTQTDWVGEVLECGGYQFVLKKVPIGDRGPDVYGVDLRMPGAGSGQSCARKDPWAQVKRTFSRVIRASRDCNQPDLDGDERVICNFAKDNAANLK